MVVVEKIIRTLLIWVLKQNQLKEKCSKARTLRSVEKSHLVIRGIKTNGSFMEMPTLERGRERWRGGSFLLRDNNGLVLISFNKQKWVISGMPDREYICMHVWTRGAKREGFEHVTCHWLAGLSVIWRLQWSGREQCEHNPDILWNCCPSCLARTYVPLLAS